MIKLTVKVEGMMCPMCEAHTNEAIRNAMKVKNVSSSHEDGETVIIAESVDEALVKETIEKNGYKVLEITYDEYEKKNFFQRIFKK